MNGPSFSDLYLAYRQAKYHLYFQRQGVGLTKLARFENNLAAKLEVLQADLKDNETWFDCLSDDELGEVWVIPKRLEPSKKDDSVVQIGYDVASEKRNLHIQLRFTPSPRYAIIEVLYLWKFGRFIDFTLRENVLGSRLKLRNVDNKDDVVDRTGRRIFEFWKDKFNDFRTKPLEVASDEIDERDEPIAVLSGDLASYYDTVDASFLTEDAFIARLRNAAKSKEKESELNVDDYKRATKTLIKSYNRYQTIAARTTGLEWACGIPIGAITSPVVANAALASFDEEVLQNEAVISYKRYVDDFIIIAEDETSGQKKLAKLDDALRAFLPIGEGEDESPYSLDVEKLKRSGSQFELQGRKLKLHLLKGGAGKDFLSNVRTDLLLLVSEHRAFLDTLELDETDPSELIKALDQTEYHALRDADRETLRNLKTSTRLQSLSRAALLLSHEEARRVTRPVIDKLSYVLKRGEDWISNVDTCIRLIKIAIHSRDWVSYSKLNKLMNEKWGGVENLKNNVSHLCHRERTVESSEAWNRLRDYLHEKRLEAVAGTVPLDPHTKGFATAFDKGLRYNGERLHGYHLRETARRYQRADLRDRDRADDYNATGPPKAISKDSDWLLSEIEDADLRARLKIIRQFILEKIDENSPWAVAAAQLFISTNPPRYSDISFECFGPKITEDVTQDEFNKLHKIVNAIRGTRYIEPAGEVVSQDGKVISLSQRSTKNQDDANPTLVLGNLIVKDEYFKGAAQKKEGSMFGETVRTLERFSDLGDVFGKAREVAKDNAGVDRTLLVLPELALPWEWRRSVTRFVAEKQYFGLISGLEYRHDLKNKVVHNQVFAIIPGRYQDVIPWYWTKRLAAPGEKKELEAMTPSVRFEEGNSDRERYVVSSPYGKLSVLICSEMLEARRVADLVDRTELVVAPALNKDTSSYDHLIQSVAFQLHSILAIANTAKYSDCRIRVPHNTKARHKRNRCRLILKDENAIVYDEIPMRELRWFKDHDGEVKDEHPNMPEGADEFRPLPPTGK